MADLEHLTYCTEYKVYAVEEDPGETADLVEIDDVIRAGLKALGLDGRFALVETELVDNGNGLW